MLVACSDKEKVIKKAGKKLEYNALIPSYLPAELELEKVVLGETSLCKLTQMMITDPYETNPNFSYVMIENFVGEYKINSNLNSIDYQFIPVYRSLF